MWITINDAWIENVEYILKENIDSSIIQRAKELLDTLKDTEEKWEAIEKQIIYGLDMETIIKCRKCNKEFTIRGMVPNVPSTCPNCGAGKEKKLVYDWFWDDYGDLQYSYDIVDWYIVKERKIIYSDEYKQLTERRKMLHDEMINKLKENYGFKILNVEMDRESHCLEVIDSTSQQEYVICDGIYGVEIKDPSPLMRAIVKVLMKQGKEYAYDWLKRLKSWIKEVK